MQHASSAQGVVTNILLESVGRLQYVWSQLPALPQGI